MDRRIKLLNIVITGFMGTGKSTVGKLIASQLGRLFIDTDEWIEQQAGKSIAHIFAKEGEAAFREWEFTAAKALASRTNLVIATGGGFLLTAQNRRLMRSNGFIITLSAEPRTIMARLANDSTRPLLQGDDPAATISGLLRARGAVYSQFMQVVVDKISAETIANKIIQQTTHLPQSHPFTVTHPNGSYPITVGFNLLDSLHKAHDLSSAFIVSDSNVQPLYADRLAEANHIQTVPADEKHKNLGSVNDIYDQMLTNGLDRSGAVVALGGGVIGDMAGFAAATYMRGIDFIQCPTTLLSMVDASVGGKTGVDLPQGKNLVGAFKQPIAVYADLSTLYSLPALQFASGMAEVIKAGLILSPQLFEQLETGDSGAVASDWHPAQLQQMVVDAIAIKQQVVEEDPYEHGKRAWLNLGHTFGHAVEQVSGYRVPHGYGVAMGLVAAARVSAELNLCSPALITRIEATLRRHHLPTRMPSNCPPEALLHAMRADKKKKGGKLRFILIRDVGDVMVSAEPTTQQILSTLTHLTTKSP